MRPMTREGLVVNELPSRAKLRPWKCPKPLHDVEPEFRPRLSPNRRMPLRDEGASDKSSGTLSGAAGHQGRIRGFRGNRCLTASRACHNPFRR